MMLEQYKGPGNSLRTKEWLLELIAMELVFSWRHVSARNVLNWMEWHRPWCEHPMAEKRGELLRD
jgi:hypothetical protein